MLLLYLPVALLVLYYGLFYYFTRTFNYWKKRGVAGPEPVAFFGNLKEMTLRKRNICEVFKDFYDMFPNEKVVGIYRMTTPCLLIRDLDIIKHIMIKDFDQFRDRGVEFSSNGLGQNLFHADGETWNALRARFTPIFTSGKLKNMYHLLDNRADLLMNFLQNSSQTKSEHDIRLVAQKYTVSTIFACAFGIDFDNFNTELDSSLKTLDKLVLTPNYALELDMMYPGLLKKLDIPFFPKPVRDYFDKLVANITSERNNQPSNRGDFMDLILQLRQMGEIINTKYKEGDQKKTIDITDDVIAAQAFVFYVAGYETSSTTISYLMYELAKNPKIQDKLREEIDAVTEAHGAARGEMTYESLKEMKYLDKIMSETLRKYPIVDPLQRKALVDYKIPGTDVVVKKDQMILVSAAGIHHDEKYYPNPEVFDPDRFDPEVVGARHSCAYLPFGVGPRNCIGMRFGGLQSRLCIAKIISRFLVETTENTRASLEIDPNRIIFGPKHNILLNIIPRTD